FEDLTGAEWRLLETLAGRTDVIVSLPYEPGRPAFAAVQSTADDLARLADRRIPELPPRFGDIAPPALAHLARAPFSHTPPARARRDRRRGPLSRGGRDARCAGTGCGRTARPVAERRRG